MFENIDSLRSKFGDASPRRSLIKGQTLKKLTKGGKNLEDLDVTLANEALAKGRARCRRPYSELRSDSFEGCTRTELLVYNDGRAMYEAKLCFVKELPLLSQIHDLAGLGIGFELYCWQACTLATVLLLMGCASLPNLLWSASEAHAHYGAAAYTDYPLTSLSLGMRCEAPSRPAVHAFAGVDGDACVRRAHTNTMCTHTICANAPTVHSSDTVIISQERPLLDPTTVHSSDTVIIITGPTPTHHNHRTDPYWILPQFTVPTQSS